MKFITRLFWKRFAKVKPLGGVACIIAVGGSAGGRYACFMSERLYTKDGVLTDAGPGFVCWYTGAHLSTPKWWRYPLPSPL